MPSLPPVNSFNSGQVLSASQLNQLATFVNSMRNINGDGKTIVVEQKNDGLTIRSLIGDAAPHIEKLSFVSADGTTMTCNRVFGDDIGTEEILVLSHPQEDPANYVSGQIVYATRVIHGTGTTGVQYQEVVSSYTLASSTPDDLTASGTAARSATWSQGSAGCIVTRERIAWDDSAKKLIALTWTETFDALGRLTAVSAETASDLVDYQPCTETE